MKKLKIFVAITMLFVLFTGNANASLADHRQIDVTIKNINLKDVDISLLFPVDYIELILNKDNMLKYSLPEEKLSDIEEIVKYVNEQNYLQALKVDNEGDISISSFEGLSEKIDDNYFSYNGAQYVKMNISDNLKNDNYDKSTWPKNSIVFSESINVNYDKPNIKILIKDSKLNKETIINLNNYKYEEIKNSTNSYLMNVSFTYSKTVNTVLIIILFIIVILLLFAYYYIKNEPNFKNTKIAKKTKKTSKK